MKTKKREKVINSPLSVAGAIVAMMWSSPYCRAVTPPQRLAVISFQTVFCTACNTTMEKKARIEVTDASFAAPHPFELYEWASSLFHFCCADTRLTMAQVNVRQRLVFNLMLTLREGNIGPNCAKHTRRGLYSIISSNTQKKEKTQTKIRKAGEWITTPAYTFHHWTAKRTLKNENQQAKFKFLQ